MNTNNDSTEARTGNTAAEQAAYWRGFEEAQLNAQHNAKVRADAPDTPRPSWLDGGADAVAMAREDGLLPAASAASTVADEGVPQDVMAALDRMCTPLHPTQLSGATANADAFCMQLIRDYVLNRPAPAASDALDVLLLTQALQDLRQAFVIAVGDKSPFARIALEKADAALSASQQGGE